MTEEITEKLMGIFSEVFPGTKTAISVETKSTDIDEWDSMAHIQLISSIEEAFNLEFEIDELLAFDSYASIAAVIEQKLKD